MLFVVLLGIEPKSEAPETSILSVVLQNPCVCKFKAF